MSVTFNTNSSDEPRLATFTANDPSFSPTFFDSCYSTLMRYYTEYVNKMSLEEALSQGLVNRDLKAVANSLAMGADPQSQDNDGNNLLHIAIRTQQLGLAKLALQHGTLICHPENTSKQTPIQQALAGSHDTVKSIACEILKSAKDLFKIEKDLELPTHSNLAKLAVRDPKVGRLFFECISKSPTFSAATEKQEYLTQALRESVKSGASRQKAFMPLVYDLVKLGADPKACFDPKSPSKNKPSIVSYCQSRNLLDFSAQMS